MVRFEKGTGPMDVVRHDRCSLVFVIYRPVLFDLFGDLCCLIEGPHFCEARSDVYNAGH
jgi:hypothetical protein